MKITYLHILGQLGHDAKALAILIGKTCWAGFRKAVCATARIAIPNGLTIVVAIVAMGIVYCAGCVPATYMAYKNGQKNDTHNPIVIEQKENEAKDFVTTLFELGCIPAWVYAEQRNYVTILASGCQVKEQGILPKLLHK